MLKTFQNISQITKKTIILEKLKWRENVWINIQANHIFLTYFTLNSEALKYSTLTMKHPL